MNRLARLVMALGLLVFSFVPTPARALCTCWGSVKQTAIYSGTGPTCAHARGGWESQAMNEALSNPNCSDHDDVCYTPIVTTFCYWDSSCGAYREAGYFSYRCAACPG